MQFFKNRNFWICVIIAVISFSGGMICHAIGSSMLLTASRTDVPTDETGAPYYIESKGSPATNDQNIIAEIAEKVGPAVVNIDVTKMEKSTFLSPSKEFEKEFGFDFNEDFRNFFEEKMIPVKGAGSGFIINKEGYILTNDHVVSKADKIKVTLKDGRSLPAKIVGSDQTLDLAVIKIEAKDLPVVMLGDSSKLKVGEWVVAIGNPYQFSNSVTVGIISALGRDLDDIGVSHLIQTDAAINPGNSGGPLIDLAGKVIGINVAIAPGAQGIGFAIPINEAKVVLQDLITKGKVVRPWLGIYMRDVDENVASFLDLPFAEGVVITDVNADSPASKAGLRKYDVIRKVNDQKITKSDEVSKAIRDKKPGDKVTLEVYRDGHNKTLTAELEEAPRE